MTKTGWSDADVPDLTGRTVVITGANSGIGLEAARVFVQRGATTVLACRDERKAAMAEAELRSEGAAALTVALRLDVADLSSVRAFAAEFGDHFGQLDLLVNNAGIMRVPHGTTVDGFERQFGTNHLGHFALTGLLLDQLLAAPNARVVTVSSIAHREATIDFENLMFENGRGYGPMTAYRRSKLANLLFAFELDRRFRHQGHSARSLAVHPGVSRTNLFNQFDHHWWSTVVRPLAGLLLQGPERGALPTLRAATDPTADGGQYYGPLGRGGTTGPPELAPSTELARDPEIAASLWDQSQRLTGVSYL